MSRPPLQPSHGRRPRGAARQPLLRRLAAVLLLLAVACGAAESPGSEAPASKAAPAARAAREPAPDFDLKRLRGGNLSLAALRGKTVVIDFWATWCPPCEFQVPELNAFYEDHRSEGDVEVLGITIDVDGEDVVGAWVDAKEVGYPILMGDEDLARRYGALGFPTTVIVAPDGTIDSQHTGLIERAALEEALERSRGVSG